MSNLLRDFRVFARTCGVTLRKYQVGPATAIIEAVKGGKGGEYAVMMARQAGKNELSALIEVYLLVLMSQRGGVMVKASPTFQPQVVNSMMRLQKRWPGWVGQLRRREGFVYQFGAAAAMFLSAAPSSNVVGATASLLLECDEAQDVEAGKWVKDFKPMAASTNAATVYWGTAWSSKTLLAEKIKELRAVEERTGEKRVWLVDADEVTAEVPAYGEYVRSQVERMGRNHPLVKTQYFLEEVDADGGLFDESRQQKMRGEHSRAIGPGPGEHLLLIDVGGVEESAVGDGVQRAMGQKRDATAVTIVRVVWDDGAVLPRYVVQDRRLWIGTSHVKLHGELVGLAESWRVSKVVVDATGIGSGLAQFLGASLGAERVLGVVIGSSVKSGLGWGFVGVVESGRWQEYVDDGEQATRQFWYEVQACEYEIAGGLLRWGVKDGISYDGLIAKGHDDLLVSASLVSTWERETVLGSGVSEIVERTDVLDEVDSGGY